MAIEIDSIFCAVRHHIFRRRYDVTEERVPRILRGLHIHALVITKAADPSLTGEVHVELLAFFSVSILD